MRKREREKFRRLLEEKRDQLLAKAARAREEHLSTLSEGGEDYVDDAVSSYTREFLLSLSDLDRRTLNLVLEALERIEDGTYGECLNCGEKIAVKRLEAVPWARYDVECQEMVERQEMADLPLRDLAKDIEKEELAAALAEDADDEDAEATGEDEGEDLDEESEDDESVDEDTGFVLDEDDT
ncbi:MAG: TraR/DksA family transcriptional regulator [Acidobacteria bacterium]|nr:MAG: TraR/DksA family transcriptional regulator [Acidobacteriota bacterium]